MNKKECSIMFEDFYIYRLVWIFFFIYCNLGGFFLKLLRYFYGVGVIFSNINGVFDVIVSEINDSKFVWVDVFNNRGVEI